MQKIYNPATLQIPGYSRANSAMIECPADPFVPLPTGASPSTLKYAELRTRAKAAIRAAALLNSEGHSEPADMQFVQAMAHTALRKLAQGKDVPANEAAAMMATPEGAVYVDSLLNQFDMEVVKDSKRLRNYVTNKLVLESDNPDPRIRMKALELLGKISDVGLFTERTEVTITNRSTVELENSLRERLQRLRSPHGVEEARVVTAPLSAVPKPDVAQILAG